GAAGPRITAARSESNQSSIRIRRLASSKLPGYAMWTRPRLSSRHREPSATSRQYGLLRTAGSDPGSRVGLSQIALLVLNSTSALLHAIGEMNARPIVTAVLLLTSFIRIAA